MADVLKILAQGQLSNSVGTIYDPTAAYNAAVKNIVLCNTDTSDHTFSLYVNGTTDSHAIRKDVTIPAKATLIVPELITLGDAAGDTISGVADVASKVTYTISGIETN